MGQPGAVEDAAGADAQPGWDADLQRGGRQHGLDRRQLCLPREAGPGGQEQVWPAEAAPSDKIHELLGWVPGTTLLLAGYHFGDNSMWITGDRLYTLDATSGKIHS